MDVMSESWSLFLEMIPRNANKCASLIAKRLTKEHRFQSYVASSASFWLTNLFEEERSGVGEG